MSAFYVLSFNFLKSFQAKDLVTKGVGRKFSRGGGATKKRPKNSKNNDK